MMQEVAALDDSMTDLTITISYKNLTVEIFFE